MEEGELREIMEKFGEIQDVVIIRDKMSLTHRGWFGLCRLERLLRYGCRMCLRDVYSSKRCRRCNYQATQQCHSSNGMHMSTFDIRFADFLGHESATSSSS